MNHIHFWISLLFSTAFFSLCYPGTPGREMKIPFRLASGDTVEIAGIDSSGIVYFSLNDFLRSQQYSASTDDSIGTLESFISSQLVQFTALSPFVVITQRFSNNSTVYQMTGQTIRTRGKYFVPAAAFIPLFEGITHQQLSYDGRRNFLAFGASAAPAYDIAGITIEKKLNGCLITVLSNKKLGDVESWLKDDGWLFVTITGATADTTALDDTKPFGAVKKVLAFQSPTSLQLTIRVTPDVVQAEATGDSTSNNLYISLRTRTEEEKKELEKNARESARQNMERDRKRWHLDVIVIDAGHGGKDPGTIGVNHTKEKDITLDVALRLGRLIEKNLRGVKVVYTRTTDKFVELYRRTQIANEAGGKIFISLHCNSMPHKPSRANGFEIYLLRPGLTEDAIAIAARENSVIDLEEGYQQRYRKLTEEEFIIVTMAQSAYMKYSEELAEIVSRSMAEDLKIKNSGVKQAGFYVLVGASMPNILVELGYLSNKKEEQVLRSRSGREKISEALFEGIKEYKTKYERALREGIGANEN
jgi:N-acetylmuramoyl-L-alanine amidase